MQAPQGGGPDAEAVGAATHFAAATVASFEVRAQKPGLLYQNAGQHPGCGVRKAHAPMIGMQRLSQLGRSLSVGINECDRWAAI